MHRVCGDVAADGAMSLSFFFLYTGELAGLEAALAKPLRFRCVCGDELQVGGEITERDRVVKEWQERHRGKEHGFVKLAP